MEQTFTISQITDYCNLIDEIVLQSEWVVQKSTEHYPDGTYELAATIHIRQMSDYADAISLLLRNGSSDSTLPLIRTLFELSVSLEYLISNDFENRARKFFFYYYKKKEIDLLKGKDGTPENYKFREELLNDKHVSQNFITSLFVDDKIDNKIAAVQDLLNGSIYKELNNYYDKEASDTEKRYWYSMQKGPKSFKKLVETLEMHSRYSISYHFWSGHTHGWDIVNKNLIFENEGAKIIAKRNPLNSNINAQETIIILRRALMNYCTLRLKREISGFTKWLIEYKQKMKIVFPRITS